MLMRDLEAAVLPRKHFDKARSLVGIAPLQRHSGMLVDQAESLQGGPVTPEQPDEVFLASGLHPIGADDDGIIGFWHGPIVSTFAK